jgi:hypothetical protein
VDLDSLSLLFLGGFERPEFGDWSSWLASSRGPLKAANPAPKKAATSLENTKILDIRDFLPPE